MEDAGMRVEQWIVRTISFFLYSSSPLQRSTNKPLCSDLLRFALEIALAVVVISLSFSSNRIELNRIECSIVEINVSRHLQEQLAVASNATGRQAVHIYYTRLIYWKNRLKVRHCKCHLNSISFCS